MKIKQFLKEVRQEVRKVTWPTKTETAKYATMVIIASLLVAFYLGGIDFVVTKILEKLI